MSDQTDPRELTKATEDKTADSTFRFFLDFISSSGSWLAKEALELQTPLDAVTRLVPIELTGQDLQKNSTK